MSAPRYPTLGDELDPFVDPAPHDDDVWDQYHVSGQFVGDAVDGLRVLDCRLERLVATGVALASTTWRNCEVVGCELSGAVLHGAALTRVEFTDCRLTGCVLADATLTQVRFRHCRLDQATLRMCSTSDVEFEECDLRGADFVEAALEAARFIRCDLGRADFSQARMRGCDLRGSAVDQVIGGRSLAGVRIDSAQVTSMALNVFSALDITIDEPLAED